MCTAWIVKRLFFVVCPKKLHVLFFSSLCDKTKQSDRLRLQLCVVLSYVIFNIDHLCVLLKGTQLNQS